MFSTEVPSSTGSSEASSPESLEKSINAGSGQIAKEPTGKRYLSNQEKLKIASLDLVGPNELAHLKRTYTVNLIKAWCGLFGSFLLLSIGANIFLTI